MNSSNKNRVNVYRCCLCQKDTVTVNVDEGVTPFSIRCRATSGCPAMAFSKFYNDKETANKIPEYEWYIPKGKEYRSLIPAMKQHIDLGGLTLRPIESLETN